MPETTVKNPEEILDALVLVESSEEISEVNPEILVTSEDTNSNNESYNDETNKTLGKSFAIRNVSSNYIVILWSLLLVALVLIFKKIKFKGSK
ncbi:Uncharacterised protein [Clostridium disporicum]|uniref:Uncharacterized protein n=1 Tax=Clostridium disporicum TaxID=84024 RepID=A0A174ITE1_9CLOT|nr:Uncharacterised protein [Clostridium disporicum]